MAKYLPLICFFIWAPLFSACSEKAKPEDPTVWQKVNIDFKQLDENGLSGPAGGKTAVNYEFCIPALEKNWTEVHKIDKTARLQKGSRGRIGCAPDKWLVIGSTHQANYRRVLYELAALPYIPKIQETFFE